MLKKIKIPATSKYLLKLSALAMFLAMFLTYPFRVEARNTSLDNPITRAVLQVYEKALAEKPGDYSTRIKRAHEYYNHGAYDLALADLTTALGQCPGSEKETRYDAVMLRAGVYRHLDKPQEALTDLNEAVGIKPSSLTTLYQRAGTLLSMGACSEARNDYRRMLTLNPRSADALLGLASVAVKENNLGIAADYLEQAVNVDPNNSNIYVKRSNIRKAMGNENGAIEDILVAISINPNNPKAIEALVSYGKSNPRVTLNGLTNAVKMAPDNGLYRYLRAGIAEAHYNYGAALKDYTHIVDNRLYDYDGLYASLANCKYALGQYNEALADIEHALSHKPVDQCKMLILKSNILSSLGKDEEALKAAADATVADPSSAEALSRLSSCYIRNKNYNEASNLLGEAILTDSEGTNPLLSLSRGIVLSDFLNEKDAAEGFFSRAADMSGFDSGDVNSLKGFALLKLGRETAATAWMDNILTSDSDPDGRVNYIGACFYCLKGDLDKALECAGKSLEKGYANFHEWNDNTEQPLSVAPLRDDLRFLNLLYRYSYLFNNNEN